MRFGEVELDLEPDPIFEQLRHEIEGAYEFDSIPFAPGDVVLDIGAHKGVVSMYLARLHPGLRIYAFEPVAENAATARRNLARNLIKGVRLIEEAVTADGRDFPMVSGHHSAEASGFFDGNALGRSTMVRSTTIPKILRRFKIKRVRLLKLDCEGAEHEILANSARWIERIEYLRGEIHMIPTLVDAGYTLEATQARFPAERAEWQIIKNAKLLT